MNDRTHPALMPMQGAQPITLAAAWISLFIGLAVLAGWTFDVTILKSVLPDLAAMKANAAVGFVLLGGSLLFSILGKQRSSLMIAGRAMALVAALIAGTALLELATGLDLGIDEFIFKERQAGLFATAASLPMSLATAGTLFVLAVAMLLLPSKAVLARRIIQFLALASLLTSTLALVGYSYGFEALHKAAPYSAMSVQTAVASLLLSVGLLYARTDFEVMGPIRSPNMGGVLARQLLPAVLGVPLLLGWMRLVEGRQLGEHGFEIGITIHTITMIIVFAYMVWCTARSMNELDSQRETAMKAEHEMRILSGIDPLTGILNRRSLHERMEREWSHSVRHQQPLSAVMLDIDWFKRVNDTHGHAAGDAILRKVAAVLVEQCRPGDLVCRYGGDEFCLLIRDTPESGAASLAARLCVTLSESQIDISGQPCMVTGSFGVAERSDEMEAVNLLIEQADQALLAAKQAGRDRVMRASCLNACPV